MKIYLPILCVCILLLSTVCIAQDDPDDAAPAPGDAPPPTAAPGDAPPPTAAPSDAPPPSDPTGGEPAPTDADKLTNAATPPTTGTSPPPNGGPEADDDDDDKPPSPKTPATNITPNPTNAKAPAANNTTQNSTLNKNNITNTTTGNNTTVKTNTTLNGTIPSVITTGNVTTYFAKSAAFKLGEQQVIVMWNTTYDANDFKSLTLGFTTTTDIPGYYAMGISSNGKMIGSKAWTCYQGAPMLYEIDLKAKNYTAFVPATTPLAKNISMTVAVVKNLTSCNYVMTIPMPGGLQGLSKSTFNVTDAFKSNTINLIFARGKIPTAGISSLAMHNTLGAGKITLDVPVSTTPNTQPKKNDAALKTNKFLLVMFGIVCIPHLL